MRLHNEHDVQVSDRGAVRCPDGEGRWRFHRVRRAISVAVLQVSALASATQAQTPATDPPPVSLYGVVTEEPTGVEGVSAAQHARQATVDSTPKARRGEFVFAPMPMVNPTLENGLSVVAGYLYRLDRDDMKTPPSVSALSGFKTSNGSWAGAFLQNLHLAHDRFRVLGVVAYGDVNYDFYGIGQTAGDLGVSIQLNQAGPAGLIDGMVRVHPRWYVGARYQLMRMTVSTTSVSIPGGPTLPPLDARLRTAALGPKIEYDSRDNPFYPRGGSHAQGIASFYDESVGGRRTYQVYQGWMSAYHAVGSRNVLAWRVGTCGAGGDVAFYDLCVLGKNQDLRGYPVGQYRDRAMIAAQAEWRSELWWRFGSAVFIGGGQVAPDFGSFTSKDTLPGGGVGLRFLLAKRNHVNLRVDYAWGRRSNALYIGVAEAF